MIGIYSLAEKLNLSKTLTCKAHSLSQNLIRRPAALRAARHGHHAIAAGLVAPFDDGDVSPKPIVAARHFSFKAFFGVEPQPGYAAVAGFEFGEQFRKFWITCGPANQADMGRPFKYILSFLLGNASQNTKDFLTGIPALTESPKPGENLLSSLFPDAARIVKNDFSILWRGYRPITTSHKDARYLLGIMNVHLAAKGLDIKRLALGSASGHALRPGIHALAAMIATRQDWKKIDGHQGNSRLAAFSIS